jgi:hypothetical protein
LLVVFTHLLAPRSSPLLSSSSSSSPSSPSAASAVCRLPPAACRLPPASTVFFLHHHHHHRQCPLPFRPSSSPSPPFPSSSHPLMLTNTSPTSSHGISTSTRTQMPPSSTTRRLDQTQTYTPSPQNWREAPFYTLLLDKFADGDPRNNDFFGSVFENDAARSTSVLAATSAASSDISTTSREWVYVPSTSLALPSLTCFGKLTVALVPRSSPPRSTLPARALIYPPAPICRPSLIHL